MYGSANATELAATIQWNDVYTFTKSPESTTSSSASSTR